MHGWVKIGTKLETKQLEKDLKNAEKNLKNYEKEAEKLNGQKEKAELDLKPYEDQKQLIKEMTDEMNRYAQNEQDVINNLKIENTQIDELNQKYAKQINNLEEIKTKIKENANHQSLVKKQVNELNAKLGNTRGYDAIKSKIDDIGKSMSNTVKKVVKWGLAVFGIRTAYNAVRGAIGTLSQYNEKLATDIEYIQFAMATILQPVIEKMIQLVYRLLSYVNYIAQAWFGVNLFANASADAMNKSVKSAEKMKKSLAGFDEMNVMSDTSTNSSSSSANIPSFDLSTPEDVPIPSWLQWIADNKELVIGALAGIALGLIAVKLGLSGIQALGIGIILAGIVLLIQDVISFLKDPSWEGFFNILGDIAIVIGGIMLLMGNWWGLLVIIVGAVVKLVADNWDKIWAILKPIATWIYNFIITPIINFIQGLFNTIISIVNTAISIINAIFTLVVGIITNPFIVAKDTILGVFNGVKTFFQGFVQVIKSLFNGDIKGVLNGFKTMFKGIMDSLWSIAKAPLNLIISGLNTLIKGANKISFDVPDWVPGIGGKKWGFNIPTIPKLASGGIINLPGKGIPIGTAIGGEAGREGVLPLTDSQAMEELGSAIGRYITINLTNNTNLDGRTIARQQSKVRANQEFAMNR